MTTDDARERVGAMLRDVILRDLFRRHETAAFLERAFRQPGPMSHRAGPMSRAAETTPRPAPVHPTLNAIKQRDGSWKA